MATFSSFQSKCLHGSSWPLPFLSKPVLRLHDILVWIRISDPYADPDPSIFIIDLQDEQNNKFSYKSFSAYYFLKVLLHHFSKVISQKSQNSGNQGFSYHFCLIIQGSGSRRPKNTWIRIRNTDPNTTSSIKKSIFL